MNIKANQVMTVSQQASNVAYDVFDLEPIMFFLSSQFALKLS